MPSHAEISRRTISILEGQVGSAAGAIAQAIGFYVGNVVFTSSPPSGYHKIYNIWAKKVGGTYQLVIDVETEPEP